MPHRLIASLVMALAAAGAAAQDAQLAAAYDGTWRNLELPITGTMRLTKLAVGADGTVTGTYIRDSRYCSSEGMPLTGKFAAGELQFTVDFGNDFRCKGTSFSFTRQPDGSFSGTGNSAFSLAAMLTPSK